MEGVYRFKFASKKSRGVSAVRASWRRRSAGSLVPELTMKSILCLVLLLAACGGDEEAPVFPNDPPRRHRFADSMPSAWQLARLAEAGARNCGVAVDRSSADHVYACAADSLARRRPFFCRFEPPPPAVVDDVGRSTGSFDASPARTGGIWAGPAAFVGTSTGVVRELYQIQPGTFALGTPVLDPNATPPPRLLGVGMTVPEPIARPTVAVPATIAGVVLVEVIIDAEGNVARSRVIKPLPLQVDKRAEELVRRMKFHPSRFFGVPVAVISNVTVEVRGGKATVR
jgi:TonB family protein